jgi:hypothetical protein
MPWHSSQAPAPLHRKATRHLPMPQTPPSTSGTRPSLLEPVWQPDHSSRPGTRAWAPFDYASGFNQCIAAVGNRPVFFGGDPTTALRLALRDLSLSSPERELRSRPMNGWVVTWAPLTPGTQRNHSVLHAAVRPILLALAVGASDYWHHALGNLPLHVRDGGGNILCRASPAADGCRDARHSDAVIEVTGAGPRAYFPAVDGVLQNIFKVEPFCCAAVQAARLQCFVTRPVYADSCALTHRCEAELDRSMKTFIAMHDPQLKELVDQVRHNQTAQTDACH